MYRATTYRATTPKHTFTLPENAENYQKIQITYRQTHKGKTVKLVKMYDGTLPEGMTFDGKNVYVRLTQKETKKFYDTDAEVQIRVLTSGGDVYASNWFEFNVHEVLDDEEL